MCTKSVKLQALNLEHLHVLMLKDGFKKKKKILQLTQADGKSDHLILVFLKTYRKILSVFCCNLLSYPQQFTTDFTCMVNVIKKVKIF